MRTRVAWVTLTLVSALLLGGGQAFARSAAAPPSIIVEVIGAGKVSGTGIDCGQGKLGCAATYADNAAQTLTATPANGWSFAGWNDGCTGTGACSIAPNDPPATATAVFTTAGAVATSQLNVAVSETSTTPDGLVANGSTPHPIDCGENDAGASPTTETDCSIDVVAQSTLSVYEVPSAGNLFSAWGGDCSGSKDTCSVYLNTNRTITASYVGSATSTLSVSVDGSGTVAGSGISCTAGTTCEQQEPPTSTVTLTESPASGYAFTGWTGACSGLQTTCTVQMSADQNVTANFDPLVPVLITVNGAGTISGASVTCGPGPATCNGSAAPNTTIQLTATPAASGGSVAWAGCSSAAGTICTINVTTQPISITASFSGGTGGGGGGGTTFTVSSTVTGDGYVTATGGATLYCTVAGGASCTASVPQNTSVTLEAIPVSESASDFEGWSGACSGVSLTCTFVVTASRTVEADFTGPGSSYSLTAALAGAGEVTGAGLQCSVTGSSGCTSPEAANASVTLTATAAPGSTFTGWSGACSGSSTTCTVIMSAEKSVTASFVTAAPGDEPLTIAITGAGTVSYPGGPCKSTGKSKTCAASARQNASVSLTATPAAGYGFSKWASACASSKTNTCTVHVTGPENIDVTFVRLVLAPGKKPAVAKLKSGYRVTLSFIAAQPGKLTVTSKPKTMRATRTIKKGAGTARITVKKPGRYVFTLSLRSKSGTHTLHLTVKV